MALHDNHFNGPIPPSLEGLDSIRFLSLYYNDFEGEVPANLCNILGPSGLSVLEADCGGDPVANECGCCTRCCDREALTCQIVDRRRLSVHPSRGNVEEYHYGDEETPHHHHPILPKRRALQAASECRARYRWVSDTGRLEVYTE